MRFLVLIILMFPYDLRAANGFVYRSNSECKLRQDQRDNEVAVLKAACTATRDKAECQSFYKTLSPRDREDKALTCSDKQIQDSVNMNFVVEAAYLCAGGFNPTKAGERLGEYIFNLGEAWQANDSCNESIPDKKAILNAYNMDVPDALKYPIPSDKDLAPMNCGVMYQTLNLYKLDKIRAVMSRYRSPESRQSMSKADAQVFSYAKRAIDDEINQPRSDLIDHMKTIFKALGLQMECYSPAEAWALKCEVASMAVSMASGAGAGAAVVALSKLSGIRAAVLETRIAELSSMSKAERVLKASTEIAPLDKTTRLAQMQSELGRTLSQPVLDAIESAHNVGNDVGEVYGTYSANSIKEKARILNLRPELSTQEADYLIYRGYVGNAPNPFLEKAMKAAESDPMYATKVASLSAKDAKALIDKNYRMLNATDSQRIDLVKSSFNEYVEHIKSLRSRADSAKTDEDRQKIEAAIETYMVRCQNAAALYEQAGWSNDRIIDEFKKQIGRWCK